MSQEGQAAGTEGVLSVQVKSLPVVAGTRTTITLVIQNPFAQDIAIESIEAPASAPLLPRLAPGAEADHWLARTFTRLSRALRISEISVGPLVAHFPIQDRPTMNIDLSGSSTMKIEDQFDDVHNLNVTVRESATLEYARSKDAEPVASRIIPAHQSDVASFELCTASWLLVTPMVADLWAVVRYRVGNLKRSQVVPFTVTIRPPLTAIVSGCAVGALLGYAARQLSVGAEPFAGWKSLLSLAGILIMAVILAIVLSRQGDSKGFVTLEDFYGAFVVGVLLGYTGTSYFDSALKAAGGH